MPDITRKTKKTSTKAEQASTEFCQAQLALWSAEPQGEVAEANRIFWSDKIFENEARSQKQLQQAQVASAWNALDVPVGTVYVDTETHEIIRICVSNDGKPRAKLVADFSLRLDSKELDEEGLLQYRLVLTNRTHTVHELPKLVPDSIMSDVRRFKAAVCNVDFNFYGGDEDLYALNTQLLRMNEVPITHSTLKLGTVKRPGTQELCWSTSEGIFDAAGALIGDFRYNNPTSAITNKFASNLRPAQELSFSPAAAMMLDINIPEVALPIFGWFAACFFKHQIFAHLGAFPILYLLGPKGAAKTETAKRLAKALWQRIGDPLASATGGTVASNMHLFTGSHTIPIVFDDLKPDQYETKIFKDLVQRLYNCVPARRGVGNQQRGGAKLVEYETVTPLCVTGERRIGDAATFERSVCVDLNPADSYPRESIFKSISDEDYAALGQALLNESLVTDEVTLEAELPFFSALTPRDRNNAAVVLFGVSKVFKALQLDIELQQLADVIMQLYRDDEEDGGAISVNRTEAAQLVSMIRSLHDAVMQDDKAVFAWPRHYLMEGVHFVKEENGVARYNIDKVWERLEPFAREVHNREIMTTKDFHRAALKEGLICKAGRRRLKSAACKNFHILGDDGIGLGVAETSDTGEYGAALKLIRKDKDD